MKLNIAFSINRNYLLFCMVTIVSVLKNNKKHFIDFYLINDGSVTLIDVNNFLENIKIFKKYKNFKISLINISSHENFIDIKFRNFKHWSKEIYYKIFVVDLFPTLEKIIFLDCDVIVTKDLQNIFKSNMDNNIFLSDSLYYKPLNKIGCNVGILLVNIKEAKKNNITKALLEYIKKYNVTEEIAIDNVCKGKILYFNNSIYTLSKKRPKKITFSQFLNVSAIHYVARKPWNMSSYCRFGTLATMRWNKYFVYFIKPSCYIMYKLFSLYVIFLHMILYSVYNRIVKIFHLQDKTKQFMNFSYKIYKKMLIVN